MADGSDLLRAAINSAPSIPEAKRDAVAEASARKKLELAPNLSPSASYNLAASQATGAGRDSMTDLERELTALTPNQIQQKYGLEEGNRLIRQQLRGIKDFNTDSRGFRNDEQVLSDTVSSVGLGLANAVGGIGALTLGVANDKAGVWAANNLRDMTEAVQATQSPTLQNNRRANKAVNELDFRDNALLFEREKETKGDILAGLTRIGRDALDSVGNTISEPTLLSDGVSQGVGSLFAAGPLGKLLGAVGKAAPASVRAGAMGRVLPSSTAVGIGAMEAGGAYTGTASEIMGMTPEQLEVNSPYYRSLREKGLSHEDAQTQAASRAGLAAGAIAGPVGVAAGGLVSRFEGAPLRVPSLGSAAGNLLRETVEEGIQGATSQTAQNVGIQNYADANRSLTEGVGEQIGTGALFGFGTAGAVQAPGMAGRAATALASATGSAVTGAIDSRVRKAEAQAMEASPLAEPKVRAAVDEATTQASVVQAAAAEVIQTSDAPEEEKAVASDYVQRLMDVNVFDAEGLAQAPLPDVLKSTIAGSKDNMDAMHRIAGMLNQKNDLSENDRLTSMFVLRQMHETINDVVRSDIEALKALPPDSEAWNLIQNYRTPMRSITETPQVQKAINQTNTEVEQAATKIQPVTDESIATPQGQQNIQNAVSLAHFAPDRANLDVNKQILAHYEQGKLQLSEAQLNALKTSNAILEASKAANEERERLGLRANQTRVSREIQTEEQKNAGNKDSAIYHIGLVYNELRKGNTQAAQDRMARFGHFVQHMQNKVEALNKHFAQGEGTPGVSYQALNPMSGTDPEWYAGTAQAVHTKSKNADGSIDYAQSVGIEAKRLADVYNSLIEAFPDLGSSRIESIPLVEALEGKPDVVAREFSQGKRTRPGSKIEAVKVVEPTKQEEAPVKQPSNKEPETTSTKSESEAVSVAEESKSTPIPESEPVVEEKPKVEVKLEPKVEEEPIVPAEKQGMDAAYPNLIGSEPDSKVTNFFKKAFNLPKEPKSRLLGSGNPIEVLTKAFASQASFRQFTGVDMPVSREFSRAIRPLINDTQDWINKLNKRLQDGPKGNNTIQRFLNGEPINRWADGKALNIAELRNGKLVYNQELIEAAVLAGLQWRLTANQFKANFDENSAAALMGIPVDDVEPTLVDRLNAQDGMSTLAAKQSLTQKIKNFWGLSANPNVPAGYTEGIPEAIAAELLEVMVENGDLKVEPFVDPNIVRKPNFYSATSELEEGDPLLESISAIERAVLVEPEDVNYFDTERPKIAPLQLRSQVVENTPEQKQMIEDAQNTPHFFHQPMLDLYKALDKDKILELFGAGDIKSKALNNEHRKSLDGQNKTIAGAFQQILALEAEATARADAKGVPLEQLPIHYAYNVTSVGRLQMLGRYNLQSTKLMRGVVLPTKSTVDLSKDSGQDYERFMLGVAQAVGVKVHKLDRNVAIAKTNKLLNGDLAPAVEMLREFHSTKKLPDGLVEALKKGLKKDLSVVALAAVSEYARLQETQDKSAFSTPIYVEADGVTNGPTNAMMLLSAGKFTPQWLRSMAKGGLFFRGQRQYDQNGRVVASSINGPRTMNELHSFPSDWGGDSNDQYQTTTDNLKLELDKLQNEFSDRKQVMDQSKALYDLMDVLLPGFTIEDNARKMERSIAKNPLTITIYGSGVKGISNKVTSAMIETLYEKMSIAAQRKADNPNLTDAEAMFGDTAVDSAMAEKQYNQFIKNLELLSDRITVRSKKKGYFVVDGEKTNNLYLKDPINFRLEKNRIKNLSENVRHLFVAPLRNAITATVGEPLMESAKLIQQATQIQSVFQEQMFKQAVEEAIAKKKEKDPRAAFDGLSRQESDKILKSVLAKFPLIETGTQTFFPGGTQSADLKDTPYGHSLTGGFRTNGQVYGPGQAGVAGIPFMVIGTGDGQAIQSLITKKDGPKNALYIFDGVNFRLDKLEEYTRKANEAIYDSWQGNPIKAVAEAYKKSLSNVDPASIPESVLKTLGVDTPELAMAGLQALATTLDEAASSVDARHRVMAKVAHSIDQMAAVEAPYEHTGIQLQGTTEEQIAAELNALLAVEEAKGSAKPTSPLIKEEPKNLIKENLNKVSEPKTKPSYGTLDTKSGARVLTYTSINKLVKELGLAPTQAAIFNQIRLSKAAKDYKVVYGTIEQLTAYADQTGRSTAELNALRDRKGVTNGLTIPGETIIYLLNNSREVLVHELIHAATYETVASVLNGRETDPELVQAVGRLLTLKDQFLELNDPAHQDALDAIRNASEPAVALNEFMAWGLANKELAKKLEKTEASPLVRLTKNLIQAIKQLFFGRSQMPKAADDMLSNLLFNTSIVVRGQPSLWSQMTQTALYMSTGYGTNERLANLNNTFNQQIVKFVGGPLSPKTISNYMAYDQANLDASKVAGMVANTGFPMTPQEVSTFKSIVVALATEAAIDPNALNKAQELFTHVTGTMEVEDFMQNPQANNPNDRAQAQKKYDVLVGNYGVSRDAQGRSSLLPVFLGLAMVSDDFRSVLAKKPLPKNVIQGMNTLDGVLENAGNQAMRSLSDRLSGTTKSQNVLDAMDSLTQRIQEVANERKTLIDQFASPTGKLIDRANEIIIDNVQTLAAKAVDLAAGTKFAPIVNVAAAIASEEQADKVAQGVTAGMNTLKGLAPLRALLNDLVGRTEANKNVYDLIKLTRSDVQQDRQQYREHLPTVIAAKFQRKLEDAEWSQLYRGLGKTDIAAYGSDPAALLPLLKNTSGELQSEVARLQALVQTSDPSHWALVNRKAQQLATYMNTGLPQTKLLRNAEAVARLLGERTARNRVVDADYIQNVDKLISLYALQGLDQNTKDTLSNLAQSEPEGMKFTLAYLIGQRVDEQAKATTGKAKYNHYKGYIPSTQQDGVSLVIAEDVRSQELIEKSYVRVGDYVGSAAEQNAPSMGYYFSPVSARSPYNQGIMQNVRQTAGGVEMSSGFTDGMTAGRIADPQEVQRITRNIGRERGIENLLPVFNELGQIVAYERSVDPAQLERLNKDTHLAKMIGVWRGRQVEEMKAGLLNERLIDSLQAMYAKDIAESASNKAQYVNLWDSSSLDPVQQDAVKLMSQEVMDYANSVYANGGFWVRRDMLTDALGERKASIGDAWTGTTRWSPNTQEQVRKLALAFGGNDAYRYLLNSEKAIQGFVKDVRVLIVVKSMVVPMANFVSNMYQMISRGVPIGNIVKSMPRKTAEINAFTKDELRRIEAEADLRAAEAANDLVKARQLKVEIQSINDSIKRLSIWPLIEAGEFSSISDAGISRDEILLSEGKLHAYMERMVEKLPASMQTAGKYALVTKDTALFQGLQKAVEYGDFLAKSIIYDDLTKRKKLSKAEALGRVTEEFVNYDRLSGRFRTYMEDMGLLWFYNFKLRSAKIALSMIRNNPLHALMASSLPMPPGLTGIGTPITDNVFTKGLEGSLGYSIGPGMAAGSWRLNPWANLAF